MEPLFLTVICGCNAGLFREALHEVYIPRIQRGNAYFAANVLGARGALLSVLVHFFEHERWGSLAKTAVEGQSLTAEDQLFILVQSGLYLTATRGLGDSDMRICYEHAESLSRSLDRPLLLYLALIGQWRYSLVTDKLSATIQVAKRVYSLAKEQNDSALMIGAYRALAVALYFLGDFDAAQRNAIRGVEIWRSASVQSPVEEVMAPAVVCLGYQALSDWHLGKIDSSHGSMAASLSLAKELNDMHALTHSLWNAGFLAHFERNPIQAERCAPELIELSTRQNFASWQAGAMVVRGWAHSVSGNTAEGIAWIEHGIENMRAAGWILCLPYALSVKAEASYLADRTCEALETITEAQAFAETREERWWCAELYRLDGVFRVAIGADETQIEASFCEAIRIAKDQKSVSLTKRAQGTYAEYRRRNASGERGFRLPLC